MSEPEKECDCDSCVLDKHQGERHKELLAALARIIEVLEYIYLRPL